jgi:hypothetical protein
MALPKWITPAGQLGIVPELDYYEFPLDAYDASGGTLVYSLVSGRLPLGLQVVPTGRIQGIPVSERIADINVDYRFTIRVTNQTTKELSDRTFTLTITNIAPPIISVPARNSYLGLFLDGTEVSLQLEALEFTPSTKLTWSISSGELPPGLTLTEFGLLSGYVEPIDDPNVRFISGRDESNNLLEIKNWDIHLWGEFGWSSPLRAVSKTFTFTVEVFDGVNYDRSTYTLRVYPRSSLTADNDDLPVDTDTLDTGVGLTIDYGNKHNPIILTKQSNLPPVRQGSYFSFNIDAIDLDGDILNYSVPALISGAFDEQDNIGDSIPYIADSITNGILFSGIYPQAVTTIDSFGNQLSERDFTNINYVEGDEVKVLGPGNFWYNATITDSAVIRLTGNTKLTAAPGNFITQDSSGANATITNVTVTTGTVNLSGDIITGLINVELPTYNITFSGNITANVGQFITQATSGANAAITAIISNYITLTGANAATQTFNVGDYITQNGSNGNALVVEQSINNPLIKIDYVSGSFTANVGNIRLNGANIGAAVPSTIFSTSTPAISSYITLTGANAATQTFNVGDYITQNNSTGNAVVVEQSINNPLIRINYISGSFTANGGNIRLNGANVNASVPATIFGTASVIYNTGRFTNGSGNIAINGSGTSIFPTANVKAVTTRTITANVGDFITQIGATGNAVITSVTEDAVGIPVEFQLGTFNPFAGNIRINGTDAGVIVTSLVQISNPFAMKANVGDYITQGSANARVTSNVFSSASLAVEFIANTFTINGSNIQINGSNVNAFPGNAVYQTDVAVTYNTANTFDVNFGGDAGIVLVNNTTSNSTVTAYLGLSAELGLISQEGTIGFDEAKFDQGTLSLPEGLQIDLETGWIYGQLPAQTINQINYDFEIITFKRDDNTYNDQELYTLTVLGDLNNRIDWITPSNLGTIENGELSDLFVTALHTNPGTPKTLYYSLKSKGSHRLPQGLNLTSTGLLSGRVSFLLFSLDNGIVTIDNGDTTFDNTYTFTVTASAVDGSISADRTFTIRVLERNKLPFENLYLKALPSQAQRDRFTNIIRNTNVFPLDLIYRIEDPYYGLAKDIKTLFLPGLNPNALSDYVAAASTNHFRKRIIFGNIKTAVALDTNFNVKYEVVYLEIQDENTNAQGQAPATTQPLDGLIENPYYDAEGNSYSTAYPNAFGNMDLVMISNLGYANKGALPEWMTSRQPDGRVLGFTRAVVLAYTKPGASALIAYRLQDQNINLNEIDFTVDRYQLDNVLSENYNIEQGAFNTSTETTFDRYPGLSSVFVDVGTVDFAVSIPFDSVNKNSIISIRALGGFDGLRNIKSGQTIVFAEQEFFRDQNDVGDYNQGWSQVQTLWDDDFWDFNNDPIITWDQAQYVPGYNENNFNPAVINQRIGIWSVTINEDNIVTLEFVQTVTPYQKLYVRNGFTYGGTNIYYDPIVKPNNIIPNYSIIPQQIRTQYTTFDGNGTRFFDNRDEYVLPGTGDKYIKFTKTGVFT